MNKRRQILERLLHGDDSARFHVRNQRSTRPSVLERDITKVAYRVGLALGTREPGKRSPILIRLQPSWGLLVCANANRYPAHRRRALKGNLSLDAQSDCIFLQMYLSKIPTF